MNSPMSVFPTHVLLLRAADGAHAKYTIVNDWNANEVGYPVHVPTPAGPVSGDNSHRSYFPTYRSLFVMGSLHRKRSGLQDGDCVWLCGIGDKYNHAGGLRGALHSDGCLGCGPRMVSLSMAHPTLDLGLYNVY